MKLEMFGHDVGQKCLFQCFKWPDGLELHGDLEVFWRGACPVAIFPLTVADYLEGVLHLHDFPVHFIQSDTGVFRIFVHGEICAVARMAANEPVLTGLHNVWKSLGARYGDVLEMQFSKPEIIHFFHTGLYDSSIGEIAVEILGETFLEQIRNRESNECEKKNEEVNCKFDELIDRKEETKPEIEQMRAEIRRLRTEVALLKHELSKRRTPTGNKSSANYGFSPVKGKMVIETDWQQKARDYLTLRINNDNTIHDGIVNVLSYFSGEVVPEKELMKIMERELHASSESVSAVLHAFPYFVKEDAGWRFDPEIHRRLMTILSSSQSFNHEKLQVNESQTGEKPQPLELPLTLEAFFEGMVQQLKQRGTRKALLSTLDRINDDVIRELDSIASDLIAEEFPVFWLHVAEYFVSRGCYSFATRFYSISEEARKNPACQLAVLFNMVTGERNIYQAVTFLERILTADLMQFLQLCDTGILEDLLKVSIILGYESEMLKVLGEQVKKLTSSNVVKVFLKCAEVGQIEEEDLSGLPENSPLDMIFIDALRMYLPVDAAQNFTEVLTEKAMYSTADALSCARNILLSCVFEGPVNIEGIPEIKETPKMFISSVPVLHNRITARNLRLKKKISQSQAEAVLETGRALGFLERGTEYYTLTEAGLKLQQAEEKGKWLILLSSMVRHAIFQKCINKLLKDGEISAEDVMILSDGTVPGRSFEFKLQYIWLRDVLMELELIEEDEEVLKLKFSKGVGDGNWLFDPVNCSV
ncbi:bZIP transcription factor [Desulfofundulus salinus]|uniref:Uncharacterized protein n=1 Tax=Desulfofundulus salinus TaxID=2419843 RepID=A0A494WXE2_9FIRM|nr:hypothetical protein [Desulfofundulus salinum]RKO67801.1 hypothetical protein D7024_13180 [Desulfofundulus salinum]